VAECSEVGWFDPADLPADALPWLAHSLQVHLLQRVWLDEVF
jgi:8-oxo-dGTP diphosphatase